MQRSLTPADWQQLEQVIVSTGHTAQVAELLLRYREGAISLAELAAAVRRCCEVAEPTRWGCPADLPGSTEPDGALDSA